jgi:nucleotide-binding universal stress UspA family protein
MVRAARADDAAVMAQRVYPELGSASKNDSRSTSGPAVVHVLNASRAGQRATAVAVSLSRRLRWPLAVVADGSNRLDPEVVATAAADEEAGLIVISATPLQARTLAALAGCPVIVAATSEQLRPFAQGPMLCVLNRTPDAAEIAWTATRFAQQLEVTLQLVFIGPDTKTAELPLTAKAVGATLLAIGTHNSSALIDLVLRSADAPVMLIPAAVARRDALRGGLESRARKSV